MSGRSKEGREVWSREPPSSPPTNNVGGGGGWLLTTPPELTIGGWGALTQQRITDKVQA